MYGFTLAALDVARCTGEVAMVAAAVWWFAIKARGDLR